MARNSALLAMAMLVATLGLELSASRAAEGRVQDPTRAPDRGDAEQALRSPPPALGGRYPAPAQPPTGAPRWLDDVRAQREALQKLRRERQEARKDEFLRRRQELRDQMATERRLFRNYGPWIEPMHPGPLPPFVQTREPSVAADESPADKARPYALPGWDNGWYYNGW